MPPNRLVDVNRVTLRERVRFWFDNSMSSAKSLWIALIVVILFAALVIGLILSVGRFAPEGEEPVGFFDGFLQALSSFGVADATPASWSYRLLMSAVVIGALFISAAIFVLVYVAVENFFAALRKGRSRVIARDHTVILNWSPIIFDVISELVVANASRRRPLIAILANKEKPEMDDEIAERLPDLGNTKIVSRSGNPTTLLDLGIMSLQTSRSVIVLSPEEESGIPDSHVIKTVLAIVHDPKRRPDAYNITAEIRDAKNADVAHIVGGEGLQLVTADDLLARILVQAVRQAGLSLVYSELMDARGCEIYTLKQPELVGKTFDFAVMAYEACTPIGLCSSGGAVHLNPPGETLIDGGHQLIIISEDDSMIRADSSTASFDESALRAQMPVPETRADRTLMIGWNRRGPLIARELSTFAAPGSLLTIAADTPDIEDQVAAMDLKSNDLEVQLHRVDTTDSDQLDSLDIPSYDHVLVLGYSDNLDPESADTQTMIALLHIRGIADRSQRRINVASEMIDVKNRELAEVTRADDFVVSNKLISLMLAQSSENKSISAVFEELFSESGCELYLRPVTDYISTERPVNFYTIAEAARRRGQIAIGYRPGRDESGGVVINPRKAAVLKFDDSDQIVVLSSN